MHPISVAIINCLKNGNKILICGNGGSASQSDHFAGEFVGRFEKERKAYFAISLSANNSVLTAIGNDYGFDYVFARQLEAYAEAGDVLITLSTSGKSRNIGEAMKTADQLGVLIYSFPSKLNTKGSTAELQELHLSLIHQISREVENALYEDTH